MSKTSRLHIMAKPPPGPREAMARLEWMAGHRSCEVLHWTLIPAQDDAGWTPATIAPVVRRLDIAPFTLVFDRASGRKGGTAEIGCRRKPAAARRLIKALCDQFAKAGIPVQREARPHVTLDYGWKGPDFDVPIAPIVWEVDLVLLIESLAGRHARLGEWALAPRQGVLPLFGIGASVPRAA